MRKTSGASGETGVTRVLIWVREDVVERNGEVVSGCDGTGGHEGMAFMEEAREGFLVRGRLLSRSSWNNEQ